MKKTLGSLVKGLVGAGLISLYSLFPAKSQETTIYDFFDHPVKHNSEWVNMSKSEKESYINNALEKDKSHLDIWEGSRKQETWCTEFKNQFLINFSGFANLDELNQENFYYDYFTFENNGKWEVPALDIGTDALYYKNNEIVDTLAHAISGFVVGNSVSDLNDFYFVNTYEHKRTNIGNWDMVDGESIVFDYYSGYAKENGNLSTDSRVLIFEKINGEYKLTKKDPAVVLTNPKNDTIPPKMEFSFKDTITNAPDSLVLKYNFQDGEYLETEEYYFGLYPNHKIEEYDFYSGHFLESGFYKIDDLSSNEFNLSREKGTRQVPIYNKSGEIPLDKSDGEHQVVVSVSDYGGIHLPGNTAFDSINYVVDTKKPELSVEGIEKNKYYPSKLSGKVVAEDEHLKDYGLILNNVKTSLKDSSGNFGFNEEGDYNIKFYANDSAGNKTTSEYKFVIDKTKPKIEIISPKQGEKYTQGDTVEVKSNVYDKHLKDSWYEVFYDANPISSKKSFNSKGSSITLDEVGNYFVFFNAVDSAGNKSTSQVGIHSEKSTGLENKLKKDFSVYPNPVDDVLNIDSDYNGKNKLEIYDSQGRLIENKEFYGNDYKINLENYDKGLYLIKINSNVEKVIKE